MTRAGAVWLSLTYRNFERAAATGADVAVAGTGADDTITLAADGTVVVGAGNRIKVTATRLDLVPPNRVEDVVVEGVQIARRCVVTAHIRPCSGDLR